MFSLTMFFLIKSPNFCQQNTDKTFIINLITEPLKSDPEGFLIVSMLQLCSLNFADNLQNSLIKTVPQIFFFNVSVVCVGRGTY